jgi:hypothetical protein
MGKRSGEKQKFCGATSDERMAAGEETLMTNPDSAVETVS